MHIDLSPSGMKQRNSMSRALLMCIHVSVTNEFAARTPEENRDTCSYKLCFTSNSTSAKLRDTCQVIY